MISRTMSFLYTKIPGLKTPKSLSSGTATRACHPPQLCTAVPQASLLRTKAGSQNKSLSTCNNEEYRSRHVGIWIGLYHGSPGELCAIRTTDQDTRISFEAWATWLEPCLLTWVCSRWFRRLSCQSCGLARQLSFGLTRRGKLGFSECRCCDDSWRK